MAKTTSIHYLKTAGLKNMQTRQKFKVELIVEVKPLVVEHLMEEFCATADFENATIHQYNYYGLDNEQEETGRN